MKKIKDKAKFKHLEDKKRKHECKRAKKRKVVSEMTEQQYTKTQKEIKERVKNTVIKAARLKDDKKRREQNATR